MYTVHVVVVASHVFSIVVYAELPSMCGLDGGIYVSMFGNELFIAYQVTEYSTEVSTEDQGCADYIRLLIVRPAVLMLYTHCTLIAQTTIIVFLIPYGAFHSICFISILLYNIRPGTEFVASQFTFTFFGRVRLL